VIAPPVEHGLGEANEIKPETKEEPVGDPWSQKIVIPSS
jgi:hypothetical protein